MSSLERLINWNVFFFSHILNISNRFIFFSQSPCKTFFCNASIINFIKKVIYVFPRAIHINLFYAEIL